MGWLRSALLLISATHFTLSECSAVGEARVTVADRPEKLPAGWEYAGEGDDGITDVPFVVMLETLPGGRSRLEDIATAVSDPHSPRFGQYLELASLRHLVEPQAGAWRAVEDWLRSHGCRTSRMVAAVSASCPVASAEAALGTTLRAVRPIGGRARYRHVGKLTVPSGLAPQSQ